MSVKVTAEIRAGLRKLIDEWGSALEIERRTHVANSSISRYLSGFLPRMNDTTWRALYPHLAKYLPDPPDVEEFLPTATPSPSEDIFRRIVYSEALSDEEKIKFLKMIVPPSSDAGALRRRRSVSGASPARRARRRVRRAPAR